MRGEGEASPPSLPALPLPAPPLPSNMLNLAIIRCDISPFFLLTLGLPNWPLFVLCKGGGELCSEDELLKTTSWLEEVVGVSEGFLLLFILLASGSSSTLSKLWSKSSFSCFMSILGRVSFSLLSRRFRLGLGNPLLLSLLLEWLKDGRCRGIGVVFRRRNWSWSGLMYCRRQSMDIWFRYGVQHSMHILHY